MNCRLAAALSAALLIPGTAFSSGLTLYGVVDTGLRYSHTASEGTTADSLQMMSGQNAGSRFGFKGGESLGSGWRVGFKLENQFESDTGNEQGGRLFHRQSTADVSSPYGTVTFGRIGTFSSAAGTYDLFFGTGDAFDGGDGLITGPYSFDTRRNNTVTYESSSAAGLTGYLQYSFSQGDEAPHESGNERYLGAAAAYRRGALNAVITAERVRYAAITGFGKREDKQVYGLAGSYDFGTFRLLGGLQYVTGADNLAGLWLGKLADGSADYGRLSGAAVGLGAVIPLGKNKVEVMTGYASGRYGKEFAQAGETYDLTGFSAAIRYHYVFSKRTEIYTGIGYQQYKKDFDTAPDRKTRITQVAAGMTHRF